MKSSLAFRPHLPVKMMTILVSGPVIGGLATQSLEFGLPKYNILDLTQYLHQQKVTVDIRMAA